MEIRNNLVSLLLALVLYGLVPTVVHAQDDDYIKDISSSERKQIVEHPKHSFGISAGINNPAGFIGFESQYYLGKNIILVGGMGLSSWGYKTSVGVGRYTAPKGWYLLFTLNMATGTILKDFEVNTTKDTTVQMTIYLFPAYAATLNFGYKWKVGKSNAFYIGAGYSFLFNRNPNKLITEYNGDYDMDEATKMTLYMLAPGGLSLQMGFLIGF
jgi:hypothetical protein